MTDRPRRILDLARDSVAGSAATSMLAASGATVWKVEDEPGGDPLRRRGPFLDVSTTTRVSLPFAWTGRGKRWIGVRGGDGADDSAASAVLEQLAAHADVAVASDVRTAQALSGRCHVVCVTPFGMTGPRSTWKASGFGVFHASGAGFVTPRAPAEGSVEVPVPQAPWGNLAEYFGAISCAIAVHAAVRAGKLVIVDLSLQECLIPLLRRETGAWLHEDYLASRAERLWRVAPSGFYATSDGYVYVNVIENKQWRALCEIVGDDDLATDERFATAESRFVHLDAMNEPLEVWFASRATAEVFDGCGRAGIPVGQVLTPEAADSSAHLVARGAVADAGKLGRWPVLPVRHVGQGPLPWPPWDDPQPGRDTDAVLREIGWDTATIDDSREAGVVF